MKWVCLQVWETFNVDMGRGTFWQNFGGIWKLTVSFSFSKLWVEGRMCKLPVKMCMNLGRAE